MIDGHFPVRRRGSSRFREGVVMKVLGMSGHAVGGDALSGTIH